jgi:transcriptional regulator with XRE-family HTH domain/quercetin dioxygenase-like cupin family protein
MTLRELARQVDVSPSFVSQIENGKSQPSVATLYAFAQLLNVSVDELFESRAALDPVSATPYEPGSDEDGDSPRRSGVRHPSEAWQPSEYANRVSVVHPSHRPMLTMADGVTWERLAATPERAVNFMKIFYTPGAISTDGGGTVTHEGYEYGYVISGELAVTIGDETFTLHEGESLGFDSSIPHSLKNTGTVDFHGIWFVHGNDGHSHQGA